MMRGRFPILQIFMLSACVCGLNVAGGWNPFSLMRSFGCVQVVFSAPSVTPLPHFSAQLPLPLRARGLWTCLLNTSSWDSSAIWACFGGKKSRGGWVYSQFAAVSVSGRAGKAGLKEGKLLLVWVNHLVQRSPGLQWHERSWKSQSTCWLAGLIGESSSLLGVNKQ